MKQFNKTHLPETITYNGKVYTLDRDKSRALQDREHFDNSNCVQVNVLARNLKGRTDLHNKPYQPTKWIYSTPFQYKVCKVFRKSKRRQVLAKDLTLQEAKSLVNSFPDSQQSMVVFFKQ